MFWIGQTESRVVIYLEILGVTQWLLLSAAHCPEILNKWPHSSFFTSIKFPCAKLGCIRQSSLMHQPPAELYQVCNVTGSCVANEVYGLAYSSNANGLTVFRGLASHVPPGDTVTGQIPKLPLVLRRMSSFCLYWCQMICWLMQVLKCLLLKTDLSWEKEKPVACREGTVGYFFVWAEKGDARNRLEEECRKGRVQLNICERRKKTSFKDSCSSGWVVRFLQGGQKRRKVATQTSGSA